MFIQYFHWDVNVPFVWFCLFFRSFCILLCMALMLELPMFALLLRNKYRATAQWICVCVCVSVWERAFWAFFLLPPLHHTIVWGYSVCISASVRQYFVRERIFLFLILSSFYPFALICHCVVSHLSCSVSTQSKVDKNRQYITTTAKTTSEKEMKQIANTN